MEEKDVVSHAIETVYNNAIFLESVLKKEIPKMGMKTRKEASACIILLQDIQARLLETPQFKGPAPSELTSVGTEHD